MEKVQLGFQFGLGRVPDHNVWDIWNLAAEGVNVTVTFHQNLHAQVEQPLQRLDPNQAVHVRVR